jgi:hypothetical protein
MKPKPKGLGQLTGEGKYYIEWQPLSKPQEVFRNRLTHFTLVRVSAFFKKLS